MKNITEQTVVVIEMTVKEARVLRDIHGGFNSSGLAVHLSAIGSEFESDVDAIDVSHTFYDALVQSVGE